jgi:hypothetical protein
LHLLILLFGFGPKSGVSWVILTLLVSFNLFPQNSWFKQTDWWSQCSLDVALAPFLMENKRNANNLFSNFKWYLIRLWHSFCRSINAKYSCHKCQELLRLQRLQPLLFADDTAFICDFGLVVNIRPVATKFWHISIKKIVVSKSLFVE